MAVDALDAQPPAVRLTPERGFNRIYFGTAGGTAIVSAATLLLAGGALRFELRLVIVCALLTYAAGAGWAWRRSADPHFEAGPALFAVSLGALFIVGGTALAWQDGVRSPTLAFCGVIACVLGALAERRYSWGVGVAGFALVGALAALEFTGHLPAPAGATPLLVVLLYQWLALGCGVIGGTLIAKLVGYSLGVAAERERRFRSLLNMSVDWYWELDADHRFTHVSSDPGASGASRRSAESPLGQRPWELRDIGLRRDEVDAHRADLEARRAFTGLLTRRTDMHGVTRFFSVSGRPRYDAGGVFKGYWGVGRDVTREIGARRAMAASESRYRELFTRSPTPLILHRRGIVIDANEAAARLLGMASADALRGFDITTLFTPGDSRERAAQRIEELERMAVGQGTDITEFQLQSLDGRRLTVQSTGVRVEADAGAATLTIFHDVTARVGAEAALRRSEAMLSLLFARSPDCITLTEMATGRYLLVNEAFVRLIGYTAQEAVGRTAGELGIWHDPADRDVVVRTLAERGRIEELPVLFRSKSGAAVSMLLSAARFDLDGREHLVINARDVTATDRVRMENEAMLSNASIGIAFTRDRRFVRVNPRFERTFGWPEGELAGQPGAVIWPDEAAYAQFGQEIGPILAQGRAIDIEHMVKRKDGSLFLCRLLAQALDPKNPASGGTIWITEDVTAQRQIEQALATARDAAEAASKAKSAFLANTSHEIRTPLNGLLGLARLARETGLEPTRRDQYLRQIQDSAQSLAGIISDILDLSKIEAGKITLEAVPVDLHALLQSLHHTYLPLAEAKGLGLTLRVADELPATVIGDPVRVRQILSNMVTNAVKFTDRGLVEIDADLSARGWVRLAVLDTGPGIDEATQARLFVPFTQADESTTRRYGGTGLGLSICRELATLMHGEVGVVSTPGEGSTFWAELPLPATQAEPQWADSSLGDPDLLHGAHVLLVEDNPVNMLIAVAMLEQWGVDVGQAVDGRLAIEAVERAQARGRPFDAVLMDVQMPGMSGHDAARLLRKRWDQRQLPIIALTAAALVSERDEALASGMNDFLTKPIDTGKLRNALVRWIGATTG
jgi:PAS domain S-box-containing protein